MDQYLSLNATVTKLSGQKHVYVKYIQTFVQKHYLHDAYDISK